MYRGVEGGVSNVFAARGGVRRGVGDVHHMDSQSLPPFKGGYVCVQGDALPLSQGDVCVHIRWHPPSQGGEQ